MLAVVGLAAALLTGCAPGKYTGGGFIQSAAGGNQKATFGFELEGIDATGAGQVTLEFGEVASGEFDVWALAKGQFTYNDHGAGVQFQFDCDEETSIPADGSFPSGVWVVTPDPFNPQATGAVFYGPYTSLRGNGSVHVSVTANGDQYANTTNSIKVELSGGPYDGYSNSGTIQGGNIQWHPASSN